MIRTIGLENPFAAAIGPFALALALAAGGCGSSGGSAATEADHHDTHGEEEHVERGPRGGWLFEADDLRLELAIAEQGIEPEFRAYLSDADGRELPARGSRLHVILDRFGGRRDSIAFRAEGDRLRGLGIVAEPHSFEATIVLERGGERHVWTHHQEEGRVRLSPEALAASGIAIGEAAPRSIEVRVRAPGEVRLNAERVVQVRPRFPGVLRRLQSRLGDRVASGDLLAVVHSNVSLSDYEIHASMSGTVVFQGAAPGQSLDTESILYTIADLSSVWVDLALYPQNVTRVRVGQEVEIRTESGDELRARGRIRYVGPLLEQDTRVSYARVVLPNRDGRWKPGLFVNGEIVVDRAEVAVAVPDAAIVRSHFGPTVFRSSGTEFELQPVETGRSDGVWTEIVSGLEPGAPIAVENSFLLKAELGRSEATHDH